MTDEIASPPVPPRDSEADITSQLAEGFFKTFAPRLTGRVRSKALQDAIGDSCSTAENPTWLAIASQPPIETRAATIRGQAHSAAGLKAIISSFRYALPRLGPSATYHNFLEVNQKDGFDCQSCAWPSPDGKRHQFEFCESGAKAMASEGSKHTIGADFFRKWSIEQLSGQSDTWLESQGRLTEPMVRRAGSSHYEPIGWDDALALIGKELNSLLSPDSAAFYTSGRASNEAAFLWQLFARQYGTNNLPDCSNMCHESSGTALVQSLGIGKGTVVLEDFEQTDLIILVGQNPGTNHPRMLTSLEHAKKHGAKILAINPMRETGFMRFTDPNPDEFPTPFHFAAHILGPGVPLADLHLPVRINGDIAVIKGLMKVMLAEDNRRGGVIDQQFIADSTNGWDAVKADLEATGWDEIVEGSGLTRAEIEAAGMMAASAKRMICCWAMGLTQHKNAVATIRTMVNMLLMGGHIGRPGAGTCCVRGHSNVQGDRTMGIWERPGEPFLQALDKEFGFRSPRHFGKDTVDTIAAMHDGSIEVFIGLGGNFLASAPDTVTTASALSHCRLTAQIATKLNRGHLITGETALLLPCLGRSEQDAGGVVTVEDSMGIISASRGKRAPAGPELRSEVGIIAGMATATLKGRTNIDWQGLATDHSRIRDHISRVVPGFENYNSRLDQPFYLPNPARQRRFVTESKKAEFFVAPIAVHPVSSERFLMTTVRSHDQFNTTIYALNDRYRGIYGGRRVVFMNEDDAREKGWATGQHVDITSHFEDERRVARHFQVVVYTIPRRCVATYFPEANVLVPIGSVADGSNTPTYKSIMVSLAESDAR